MSYSFSGGLPQYDPDLETGDGPDFIEWLARDMTDEELFSEVVSLNLIDTDTQTRLDPEGVVKAWNSGLLEVTDRDLPTDDAVAYPTEIIISYAIANDGPWWVAVDATTTEIS